MLIKSLRLKKVKIVKKSINLYQIEGLNHDFITDPFIKCNIASNNFDQKCMLNRQPIIFKRFILSQG